ncbi:MAG: hypothetical protein ABR575_01055, partial [Actinomycetota bacterium]
MKKNLLLRMGAALLAFALLGAACSSDTETDAGSAANKSASADTDMDKELAVGVDTPAATLNRDLTHLLDLHEYNAGIAIYTAVQAGGDLKDPTVAAAVQELDDNSVALSEAIGSVYGDAGA